MNLIQKLAQKSAQKEQDYKEHFGDDSLTMSIFPGDPLHPTEEDFRNYIQQLDNAISDGMSIKPEIGYGPEKLIY